MTLRTWPEESTTSYSASEALRMSTRLGATTSMSPSPLGETAKVPSSELSGTVIPLHVATSPVAEALGS